MQTILQKQPTCAGEMPATDEVSLVKLHATLCFLMTQFLSHQCPKLSQFIVRHLSMLITHPEVANASESRVLYLQLQQHWQNVTTSLLEQRKTVAAKPKVLH